MAYGRDRLAVLAPTITHLTMFCPLDLVDQISRQLPLLFPTLLHLSVEFWAASIVGEDGLRPFLGRLVCPKLKSLEFKGRLNARNVFGMYDGLEQILQEGMFPSLDSLKGQLDLRFEMSAGIAQALHQKIRNACQSAGDDYSKMEFILPDEE